MLLALAHLFSMPSFVAGVSARDESPCGWPPSAAPHRGPTRRRSPTRLARPRSALAVGLVFLLAVAITRPFYPVGTSLAVRSAWRYWADGLEVAAAGHVPATSQQWGLEIPTTVSKVMLNAFEGGVSFLLGADPFDPIQAILVVIAVGLAAALLALGRELGLGVFSALVPALAVLVPERLPLSHALTNDLRWYTAEDVGRMVAFCGLLAGIHALRADRRRAAAVVTGVMLAVAGLTHLVPPRSSPAPCWRSTRSPSSPSSGGCSDALPPSGWPPRRRSASSTRASSR